MKIRIAVLEDEINERKDLEDKLSLFFNENNIEYELVVFSNADEFIKHGNGFKDIQLLLMDIILPGNITGMDLAKEVRKVNEDISIIFITKTASFALEGYKVDALDYIMKPLVYEEFSLKMKKALKYIALHQEKILTLKLNDGVIRLGESRIYYIEAMLHYLNIYTMKGTFKVRGTISSMEKELSKSFVRCNNSYIVNLRHIDGIEDNMILMRGGDKIPITRSRKQAFYDAFNVYNGVL